MRLSTVFALLALAPIGGCVIDELTEDEVGDEPYCEGAHRWPNDYAARENDLLDEIADLRRSGTTCDDRRWDPVTPLELVPELHCASRLHATDLATHDSVGPEGSDGGTPFSRANRSGYAGIPRYELSAANYEHAEAVLEAWLADPTHCAALLDRRVRHIGVGHSQSAKGDAIAWVVDLGEPRD